jgi:hypothetical protein
LSYESELLILALVLYLYDSTVLLYSNEALLIRIDAERWTYATGWEGFGVAGRLLYINNPLTPNRPVFRLTWSFSSLAPGPPAGELSAPWAAQLGALAPMGMIAGLALFVVLPLGFYTGAGTYAEIPAVIGLYGSTLIALCLLYRRRVGLAIGHKRMIALAFECLACPPLAINLVRRIGLATSINESLLTAAVRLLPPLEWQRLRDHCIQLLDDAILSEADDSGKVRILNEQKQRLLTLVQSR